MIQRKQSVYLLLVAVLMSWLLVQPYAQIELADGRMLLFKSMVIKSTTTESVVNFKYTFLLVILVIVTGALNFVNIFLFSRRIFQIRLCVVSAVLLILILLTMLYHYFMIKNTMENTLHVFRLAAIFPAIGLILNIMAYRAIHQDEMLVKSYDRIR